MYTIAALTVLTAISQFPDTFLGSVAVGNDPVDVCISPDGQRAYAAVQWGYATAVDINDYADFSLAGLVSIDGEPSAVQTDGTGQILYVADSENSLVHVVDTETLTEQASFAIEPSPVDMVLCQEEHRIFLSHSNGMVTVINTQTESVEDVFWAGVSLHSLAISPDGTVIYAPDNGSALESVISTATGTLNRVNSGMDSRAGTVSGTGEWLFLSSTEWDMIGVMDTGDHTMETSIACTGEAPTEMAALPDLPYLYGVVSDENLLCVYGTDDFQYKGTVEVPGEPVNLAIHPDGERIFLVCSGDNRMRIYGFDPAGIEPGISAGSIAVSASPSTSPSFVISGVTGPVDISVYDVSGRLVWHEHACLQGGDPARFTVDDAPPGLLLVSARAGGTRLLAEMVVLEP